MKIHILTDSASDLPFSFIEEENLTLFPLGVTIDGKEYEDLITIHPSEVYEEIEKGHVPKTSQVSPNLFKETFSKLAKENISCIYIAFSSELSGTYQTAKMISDQVKEEFPNFDITIINSKCASLGQGIIVKEAVEYVKKGVSKDQLIQSIKSNCEHMQHIFTVDDLDFLARGGRVSKTSAFVGGILNIKPLLNVEEGKLLPIEKLRGRKKVIKRMVELMKERGENLIEQTIGISHGNDEKFAIELKEAIINEIGCQNYFINVIGSAIGSHAGPGTLALFFLGKQVNTI